jgi:FAD/FMN-containing dehydrogenase
MLRRILISVAVQILIHLPYIDLQARHGKRGDWGRQFTKLINHADFWSPTTYGSPACVFSPTNTGQVSDAVRALALAKVQFAIRGGGHLAIPGYANTDSGVFIALTGLNSTILFRDKSVVSVDAGMRWGDVLDFLEPHGRVVVSGHVGVVGVSGLLLGGGVGHYSNQYGLSSDSVVAFEVCAEKNLIFTCTCKIKTNKQVVLGNGRVVCNLAAGTRPILGAKRRREQLWNRYMI